MKKILDYITLQSFEIEREHIDIDYSIDEDDITHHQTKMFPEFNVYENYVKLDIELSIFTFISKTEIDSKVMINISFVYEVENLDKLIKRTKKGTILDIPLFTVLLENSYSTLRGILMVRLQHTLFRNFYLPMVDANDFLELIE